MGKPLSFEEHLATFSEDQQKRVLETLDKMPEALRKQYTEFECECCGSCATGYSTKLSSTYHHVIDPEDQTSHMLLAQNIDPGPGKVEVRPLTYDKFFICPEGHETFIETFAVRSGG